MPKSNRQFRLDAQYFGGLALVCLVGAIVGLLAGSVELASVGLVASAVNGILAFRRLRKARDSDL